MNVGLSDHQSISLSAYVSPSNNFWTYQWISLCLQKLNIKGTLYQKKLDTCGSYSYVAGTYFTLIES
jgi:hypothetical protein